MTLVLVYLAGAALGCIIFGFGTFRAIAKENAGLKVPLVDWPFSVGLLLLLWPVIPFWLALSGLSKLLTRHYKRKASQ